MKFPAFSLNSYAVCVHWLHFSASASDLWLVHICVDVYKASTYSKWVQLAGAIEEEYPRILTSLLPSHMENENGKKVIIINTM